MSEMSIPRAPSQRRSSGCGRTAYAVDWKGLGALVLLEAGITRDPDGTVRIPYRLADGSTANVRIVAPNGRQWWARRGRPLIPFGLERLAPFDGRTRRLVWIAEGESDALALREHCATWRGYAVDVLGLPGASTWRVEWTAHLAGYRSVYLFPDGDSAGERMAAVVAQTVPGVFVVRPGTGQDARSVLQAAAGPDGLDALIIRAEGAALLWAGIRLCSTLPALQVWLGEVTW